MITDKKEIEKSALSLDKKDKARLADLLLKSIHGDIDPDIEQAWIQEVQNRKETLQSGEASLHSASQVLDEARKRIQKGPLSFILKPEKNFFKAADYYEEQVIGLGDVFINEVEKVFNVIEQYPSSGTKITPTERRFLVSRFPFGIIYSVGDDLIKIFAVMDLRQKPDYWKSRTGQVNHGYNKALQVGRSRGFAGFLAYDWGIA